MEGGFSPLALISLSCTNLVAESQEENLTAESHFSSLISSKIERVIFQFKLLRLSQRAVLCGVQCNQFIICF